MKMIRLAMVPALMLFLFSCKKDTVAPQEESVAGTGGSSDVVYNVKKSSVLQLVNDVRSKGCNCGVTAMPAVSALTWNDLLAKAAYDHSKDMSDNSYFSHSSLSGTNSGQRISAAGYAWTAYGENIAKGFTEEEAVVNAWLASEGHCKNLMNASFKEFGLGKEGSYWTQTFGSK